MNLGRSGPQPIQDIRDVGLVAAQHTGWQAIPIPIVTWFALFLH